MPYVTLILLSEPLNPVQGWVEVIQRNTAYGHIRINATEP